MTNKLFVIINSLKVPKIKKILLYEMKFLVPNYSCLQIRGLLLPDPRSLCPLSSTEFGEPPSSRKKFLGTPLSITCFDVLTPGCHNINRNQAELLCTKPCLHGSINSGTLAKFSEGIWWKPFWRLRRRLERNFSESVVRVWIECAFYTGSFKKIWTI